MFLFIKIPSSTPACVAFYMFKLLEADASVNLAVGSSVDLELRFSPSAGPSTRRLQEDSWKIKRARLSIGIRR